MRSPEAIDDGQNKQALQHANKLLKKNPDWPLIKVDNSLHDMCVNIKRRFLS